MFNRIKKNEGASLVMVLIVMLVLFILGTSLMTISVAENRFSIKNERMVKSHYIARSGAQAVAEYISEDPLIKAAALVGKTSDLNNQIGDGSFSVTVTEHPRHFRIASTGHYQDTMQTVNILVPKTTIFDHALAANALIGPSQAAGTGIRITGKVISKYGPIQQSIKDAVGEGNWEIDDTLFFPEIVPPASYDQIFGNITSNTSIATIPNADRNYFTTGISGNHTTITATGNGDAHIYVQGNIEMGPHAGFVTEGDSRIYIYVLGDYTVELRGTGTNNQVFIYAPDATVEWNNANGHSLYGAIIADRIILHNHTSIGYNAGLSGSVNLDRRNYIWVD